MQAVILAAGMGKRLKELTRNATKCMVEVNGKTLIQRALEALDGLGLERIVLVTGYQGEKLKAYVEGLGSKTPLCYVDNPIYDQTNNIYSLYLAREYLLQDDTLLLESDLIFEEKILRRLVDDPYPSLALVAHYEPWMDGTVVTLNEENDITRFIGKKEFDFAETESYYKTVNIYKFGKDFSRSYYVPFLEAYCKALGHNEYYEQVLKVLAYLDTPVIRALPLEGEAWYEIDDVQDLEIAETLFASGKEKLRKMQSRYGGYWRFPGLLDFCYLVNPFYPGPKLIAELKNSFTALLTNYPSGMEENSLLAAKYYGLRKDQILVGNGAAELIKALLEYLTGNLGVIFPTFEEYPNRKPEEVIAYVPPKKPVPRSYGETLEEIRRTNLAHGSYAYDPEDVIAFFEDKDIQILTLINPDNPSGNYIPKEGVLRLARWAEEKGIIFVLDESFADFADEEAPSLLTPEILKEYPSLIIVKSISKSFGVPGLRLGVLASGHTPWIARLKKQVAIWNINSFGEYYMQISEKYRKDYEEGLRRFSQVRCEMMRDLCTIPGLLVYPSQANYLLCEIRGEETKEGRRSMTATELTERLLNDYSILIKDLSGKKGLEGEWIRLAIRRPEENDFLVNALRDLLTETEKRQ